MSFTRSEIIEAGMDVNKAVVREEDLGEIEDKRQLVSPEVTVAFMS
jgi:hypothetical protein